jgi:hypothetical protein
MRSLVNGQAFVCGSFNDVLSTAQATQHIMDHSLSITNYKGGRDVCYGTIPTCVLEMP